MRLRLVAAAVSCALLLSPSVASAGTGEGAAGGGVRGTTIDVSARVRRAFGIPVIDTSSSAGRCIEWRPYWREAGGSSPQDIAGTDVDGVDVRNGVVYWEWMAIECGTDPPLVVWGGFLPQITGADLLPLLLEELRSRQLSAPEVLFRGLDPEFGWAYVTVPFGFRVGNTGPVAVTARVSAGPLFVWATMTATPSEIVFDPGEPDGHVVSCSAAGAASPGFDSTRPSECSYAYTHSSSIAPNGRAFATSTSMTYEISYRSSAGSGSFPAVTTSSTAALAVAEIQALVTCTGPRPEQGGCG